jgi:ABC-2 type transport system ATP-binding protein
MNSQDQPEKSILIKIKNLKKSYFELNVLNGVNLNIEEGKFYALLGENGTGKSTLLKILMGAERFDDGEITYNISQPVAGPRNLRKGPTALDLELMGYVSELLDFDSPLNTLKFLNIYKEFYPNWDEVYFKKLIKDRNLNLNKKFSEYSRGQKMQIALIAQLSLRPRLIMVDEITSVLDIYARKYFMNELHQLVQAGSTVCMTTNIIFEVESYATDIILLGEGKIKLHAPLNQIPQNFIKLRKLSVLGKSEKFQKIFSDPMCFWAGVNSDGSVSYIMDKLLFEKYRLEDFGGEVDEIIDRRELKLDDIFVYYYNCQIHTHGSSLT